MNFTLYIERQKQIIRTRHEGETFLIDKGECIPVNECERLFLELSNSKGLNMRERQAYARRKIERAV